jgi:electron transfer flavoprotein alpha/beta subunit
MRPSSFKLILIVCIGWDKLIMNLNIVVCIKHVPETRNPDQGQRGPRDKLFDEYTVEEGLRLKKYGGSVKVLTMSPPSEACLRDSIAMGCDEA